MRIIKFNIWDKENKCFCNPMTYWKESYNELFDEEKYIFLQFTGLLDSEWSEIYEWDILKEEYWYDDTPYNYYEVKIWETQWRFWVYYWDGNMFVSAMNRMEVIWNIYENPELITK